MGWHGGRGRAVVPDIAVTPDGDQAVVKCLHCGESARVGRALVEVMESWFARDHRCGSSRGA